MQNVQSRGPPGLELRTTGLDNTGFPGDVRVAFFNIPLGNKDVVVPNPLTKEESCRVYNCEDQ